MSPPVDIRRQSREARKRDTAYVEIVLPLPDLFACQPRFAFFFFFTAPRRCFLTAFFEIDFLAAFFDFLATFLTAFETAFLAGFFDAFLAAFLGEGIVASGTGMS